MAVTVLIAILLLCSADILAQADAPQLTQAQYDEIVEGTTSYNTARAIESAEALYYIGERTNDDNARLWGALTLARRYFFMMDRDRWTFWDGRAKECAERMAAADGRVMDVYWRNTELWNGDTTYYDRITRKDVMEMCSTGKGVASGLFKGMPDRGIGVCNTILDYCRKSNDTISIPAINALIGKALLTERKGYAAIALQEAMRAFEVQRKYVRRYFPYLTERDRYCVWRSCFEDAFSIARMAVECGRMDDSEVMFTAYDQLLLNKGVLLSTSTNVLSAIRDNGSIMEQWQRLCRLKRRLAAIPIRTDERAAAELECNGMERDVAAMVDIDVPDCRGRDVWMSLKDDEAAMEFFVMEGRYYGMLLNRNRPRPIIIPCGDVDSSNGGSMPENVYASVWQTVVRMCPGLRTIYFSPVGVLNVLPIEHCTTDDGRIMSERFTMRRLSSTRQLLKRRAGNGERSMAIWGGVKYGVMADGYIPPLGNSAVETENIRRCMKAVKYKVRVYKGKDATEASLRQQSGSSPAILHFATHGFFGNRGEDSGWLSEYEDKVLKHSGLILADNRDDDTADDDTADDDATADNGICTAQEISSIDLSGTDLVVLSACYSGQGYVDADGVFGLQRGFKKAGAGAVMMALWQVNDNAAMLLMTEFYRSLSTGRSKAESLREAQRYLRTYKGGYYSSEENWAGFILMD